MSGLEDIKDDNLVKLAKYKLDKKGYSIKSLIGLNKKSVEDIEEHELRREIEKRNLEHRL